MPFIRDQRIIARKIPAGSAGSENI